ncbi:MAG: YiiX/YebB-like N1pC/P60 family cysteine hydrolase [Candidatus Thermoplasmatota archaeon]|nr:YiiX/YebB-like N1pC/P60 family cysteine hydrolase [Candidatus Thermoplasmatota archaeon]
MKEKKAVVALIVVLLASLALAPIVKETSVISENATYRATEREPAEYNNIFSLAKPIRISVGSEGVKITELDYVASELDENEVELTTEYIVEGKEDGTVVISSTTSIRDSSGVIETETSQMSVEESLYTETVEYTASDEDIANDLVFTGLLMAALPDGTTTETETETSEISLTIVSLEVNGTEPTAGLWKKIKRAVSRAAKAIRRVALAIVTIAMHVPRLLASSYKIFSGKGDGNKADFSKAQPGDILFGRTPGFMDWIIPGYWTHVGMYIGNGKVIEAVPKGVVCSDIEKWRSYDAAAIGRVWTASYSQVQSAIEFAKAQLGKPYDYYLADKRVYGRSYYCSELVWAAYKHVGIDIDKNPGWTWKYANGVAPQEIYEDNDVHIIEYSD